MIAIIQNAELVARAVLGTFQGAKAARSG